MKTPSSWGSLPWLVVLNRRIRRGAAAGAVLVALGALAGCGTPPHLDRQQQVAFARACVSLIERNIVQADPPVKDLSDERLDLDDPEAFYSTLERLRGPDTFDFNNPDDAAKSPKDKLDDACRPRNASSK
jgi:hypothetical protein